MPITIDQLKALCEGEDLKYFLAPDRPMVMLGFGGVYGRYQVVIPIELDGRFLQIRTINYLHCPSDHPAVNAVLAVLGSLNYQLRMTKFGWDPNDGEIVAYADVWVEDGTITQQQFGALFKSLLPGMDLNFKRLSATIESGVDPGEVTPADILGATLPPELRDIVDKINAAQAGGDKPSKEKSGKKFEKV